MRLIYGIFILALLSAASTRKQSRFTTTYECVEGKKCRRKSLSTDGSSDGSSDGSPSLSEHASLPACRLACSPAAGLWPMPTGTIRTSNTYVPVSPRDFQFSDIVGLRNDTAAVAWEMVNIFKRNLRYGHWPFEPKDANRKVLVRLTVKSSNLELNWRTNEAYDLEIVTLESSVSVAVSAQTVYGLRHGLETLSQLMAPIPSLDQLVILDSAVIYDKPVFQHRGLLIDTARHYLTVEDILRTLDALASVKMNTLHWHATDSQSFPLEIKSQPLMAIYGAYDQDKTYTAKDMQFIRNYANLRGIRIILELDSPTHVGAGWEWGKSEGLGDLAVCVNRQPWRKYCVQPPCGQLNPVNPNTLKVLKDIYDELVETFGRDGMMHLGGDELFVNCWNSTDEIVSEMAKRGLGRGHEDFLKLWADFHNEQLRLLNSYRKPDSTDQVIVWSSLLSTPDNIEKYLDKDRFIIQTWVELNSTLVPELLGLGYKLIVSTKDSWYLDHGFTRYTKYHDWQKVYGNRIPQHPGVLGGEACLWGEYVTGDNLDSRLWPRTAAVAERLWTDSPKINAYGAQPRLRAHIDRLKLRSVYPEAISPEWCNQHDGQCD